MRWEAANKATANLALALGEDGVVTPNGGLPVSCKVIISRDDAQIAPTSQSNSYYEVYDVAVGQYRTKLDFPSAPFEDANLIGATVTVGSEVWLVEYIVKRDGFMTYTIGRKTS